MKTQRNIVKLGSSIGATFPKELCKALGLEQGDLVELDITLLQKKIPAPSSGPAGDNAA